MNAVGLIFADSYDVALDELTAQRTLAAIPFGARYRVIDFKLSNMVNAGIRNIGIITTQKYSSLMWHIRGGSFWDLDRKQSGIRFLPPYAYEGVNSNYENRLEAMLAHLDYLKECREKYVVFGCCNYVENVSYEDAMKMHVDTDATITCIYTKNPINKSTNLHVTTFEIDDDGKITGCYFEDKLNGSPKNVSANTFIIKREELIQLIEKASRSGGVSFRNDVLIPLVKQGKVMGCEATRPMLFLDDLSCYLKSNLKLLEPDTRKQLLKNEDRPIVTRVKDSAPTRYGKDALVTNSIIADGAIIDGEVRNSIIFRGVRVKKGAVVENSVIMQDSTIGTGAHLNYAVIDKDAVIQDGRLLSGYITHPFFAGKGVVI